MEDRHVFVCESVKTLENRFLGIDGFQVTYNSLLRNFTTWKIGGPVWAMIWVPDITSFMITTAALDETGIPWRILGKGSNVLFPDTGYQGVIVRLAGECALVRRPKTTLLEAGGGTTLARVVSVSLQESLSGGEFLVGIPGTVGGALMVNAGCFGREIGDLVESVLVRDRKGKIHWLEGEHAGFCYRNSFLRDGRFSVMKARFRFTASSADRVRERIRKFNRIRKLTQPVGEHSAGCVFKNPEKEFAAKIIDSLGLKGLRSGDAQVSPKHSNFIINRGTATARQVQFLMEWVRSEVYRSRKLLLENEIEVW